MPHASDGTTWRCGRLEVHEYGAPEAPVLLLLHGITDSGRCWGDLVRRLGSSYRIVAPDALGHGGSDRFTAEELTSEHPPEAMYDAAAQVLREVGPALVTGHSMGGRTAAALAARSPELVRAVVLEDPAWFDASPWADSEEEATRERVASALAVAADPEGAIRACRAEHPTWPEVELGPWARAKADVDLEFLRTGRLDISTPWRDVAAAITVPALLVTGDGEVIIGPSVRSEISRVAPTIDLAVVPGAAHCVRRDQGDRFHAVVDPWLARLPSRLSPPPPPG
ncbi:MAG: alpha/beta fold hydrolase [Marmoricola sp.]|nr:alpha/beta fold hydrolase [Marmoricola sp.]